MCLFKDTKGLTTYMIKKMRRTKNCGRGGGGLRTRGKLSIREEKKAQKFALAAKISES